MAIHRALSLIDKISFKVVSGITPPNNPAKNTFWVNTDAPIHHWSINGKEPAKKSNNKNLICYPYHHTTTTIDGIKFTDNKDGSVTATGTSTASSSSIFRISATNLTASNHNTIYLTKGTYTLSGCPAGGGSSKYAIELYDEQSSINSGASDIRIGRDYGNGLTFTLESDTFVRIAIFIVSGVTVSNLIFKPQIEKGSSATTFIKGSATGQVWIEEKSTSPIELNSLKVNAIINQPYQIKQWDGNAWVIKAGRLYKTQMNYLAFGPYEQLEYIETTGTQYIDTDITVFNQSVFSIEYVATFTAVNYNYNCVWSSTGGDENYQIWVYSDKRLAYKWGSSSAVASSSVKADTLKHTYTFNKNANAISLSVDGTQKLSSTNAGTLNKPIRLFTKDKSYYGKAKVYEIKIYVSGKLLYHLIPARRIEDGVIGLRDILNDKFYINNGTGTFGAGSIQAFLE